jgi:hypothetical protein
MAEPTRELTLRSLAEPTDVNYGGKVHGGMVMTWIDAEGKPAAVPRWAPITEADQALERYALRLMELRRDIEDEMRPYLGM